MRSEYWAVKNIIQYLNEILTLLGEGWRKTPRIILLFLCVFLLDLAGFGLIAPFIALVLEIGYKTDSIIDEILNLVGLNLDHNTLIFWLSILLGFLFVTKAFTSIYTNNFIIRFSQEQQIRLRSRLMLSHQNLPYEVCLQRNSAELTHSVQSLTSQFQNVIQQFLRITSDRSFTICIFLLLTW